MTYLMLFYFRPNAAAGQFHAPRFPPAPPSSLASSEGVRLESLTYGWSLRLEESQPSRSMVTLLRVQNRQYFVETCVVTIGTRSG